MREPRVSSYPSAVRQKGDDSMTPNKPATGTFLRIPYDWRPTGFWSRLKQRWWNPADPRLFTPKAFGWGYDINLARVFRRKPN